MRRRSLLAGLATTAPVVAFGQQSVAVVGLLHSAAPSYVERLYKSLRKGLAEQGYSEGRNLRIEARFAAAHPERLEPLARELVDLKVDAILAAGGTAPGIAVKAATNTIPTVFVSAADPVKAGIVASLGRPGGNITGISMIGATLEPKRLEILGGVVPKTKALGALVNPNYPDYELQVSSFTKAAEALQRRIEIVRVTQRAEIDTAVEELAERSGGFALAQDPLFGSEIPRIVQTANRNRLPGIYWNREFVDIGGLMSYGPDFADSYRQAGVYLGKILKGAKPADLPVLQPEKFELAINLKTANLIGLTFPPSILARADEVIE